MNKKVLWCVAIGAGAVSVTAGTILAVMYGRDIYLCASEKAAKFRSAKDKVLTRLISKQNRIGDA